MPKDMDQAAKMVKMRIKIDVWSKGLDEEVREEIRDNLRDLFCQLPSRRVWYYLKHIRHMQIKGKQALRGIKSQLDADHLMEGPEDVIVNGKYSSLDDLHDHSTQHFHSKSPNLGQPPMSPYVLCYFESHPPYQKPGF